MSGDSTHRSGAPDPYRWAVRVQSADRHSTLVHARRHTFPVGPPAGFSATDPAPSAVEYLLGALAGDLLSTFSRLAARRGIPLDALEASVAGTLHNPLVALGVVGEEGDPGFEEIRCTVYVTAPASEAELQEIWTETIRGSPLVHTLRRAASLVLDLQVMP